MDTDVAGGLIGAFAALILLLTPTRKAEPSYQGRSLSAWLKDMEKMENWGGFPEPMDNTNRRPWVAFRAIARLFKPQVQKPCGNATPWFPR